MSPACDYGPPRRIAELQDRSIKEASGLAASVRTPGAFWTLNDGDNSSQLFAFDAGGRRLGTFKLENARNEDWEALQIGPGRGGAPSLYVGDTGDNTGSRRESIIYRVAEPELPAVSEKPVERSLQAEVFRFTVPGGSRDIEALLVHPLTGEVALVSKEFSGRSRVYSLPLPLDATRRASLEQVGELDLRQLGPFGSSLTDGSVSPDGRRVVLRTYLAALEYPLPEGAPLASFVTQLPSAFRLAETAQGEGITYRRDSQALLTIGEGTPALLFQLDRRCS
jgi:hypothetical protein